MEVNAAVSHLEIQPMFSESIKAWWKTRAYKNKGAESILYLMFFSGLLVWTWLDASWQIQRTMLFVHIAFGLFIFPFTVVPFWLSHRNLIKRSRKVFLKRSGTVLDYLLATCSLSGVYLFFWGAPGNDFGWLIQNIHFYTSWLLVPLIFAHALRWSVLNLRQYLRQYLRK